jgi:heme exporter protein D
LNDFFSMGGYAQYVWSAFGISVAVLIGTVVLSKRGLARTRARLARRLQSRQEARA